MIKESEKKREKERQREISTILTAIINTFSSIYRYLCAVTRVRVTRVVVRRVPNDVRGDDKGDSDVSG